MKTILALALLLANSIKRILNERRESLLGGSIQSIKIILINYNDRKGDNNKKLPSFYQSLICRVHVVSGIVYANKAITGRHKNAKTKS